jgi:hypothetical protein
VAAIDIKSSEFICFLMMRTILTLDDDVAAALERLRRNGRIGPETTAMKRCLVASATWASAVDLGNRCARER